MHGLPDDQGRPIIAYGGLNHAIYEEHATPVSMWTTWLTCCGMAFNRNFTTTGMVTCLVCLSNLSLSVTAEVRE